ncbi:acetamidase/formamidase family protein [Stutzerimonas tarimensis]|uniref:Acetamidase/formamidase family protein n=1 Tax=Stutzerimonas tarimensis TaxID=1507735 RepID=A0ABV7T434_9GAMM
MNDLRRISFGALPQGLRQAALEDVFARLRLLTSQSQAALADDCLTLCSSPRGSQFLQLSASPQVLMPMPADVRSRAVFLVALLSGRGQITEGSEKLAIQSGELLLLDPARAWRLELTSEFRAVLVRLENASFVLRLVHTGTLSANRIAASSGGVAAICQALVRSIGEQLGRLDLAETAPLEATLGDLLVASLARNDSSAVDDPSAVQLVHLRRVCARIEPRLGDDQLQIDDIARLEGFSTRYVQKLFKAGSTTFGEYLKQRRLERCRLDLSDPSLSRFSISDLCFRWGFRDAANFSRAFSAAFGMAPRTYRAMPKAASAAPLQRGRPEQPSSAHQPHPGAPRSELPRRHPHEVLRDQSHYSLSLVLAPKRATADGLPEPGSPRHYYVPVSEKTVHWGYFSRSIKPVLSVNSGDLVTIETLTQHASDDCERMIQGDPGAESVFRWTPDEKAVDRRGAGPMDASIFGRGAGEGFGVHICTGPVYVRDAEPGDVLEIRILDIMPRPSGHPDHQGKVYGSNAATWWGYQYGDLVTEPKKREVVTLYEIDTVNQPPLARALYNYRWTPQTDPYGVIHPTIDYPGVPVDPTTIERRFGVLKDAVVPVRPHFGVLAVAPKEHGAVDSIPPSYFGGNLDNWRAGKGARLFLPVSVEGALFSVGDPHASQGDSELCGTAIECSLTGVFQLVLHKKRDLAGNFLGELNYPFLDTPDHWVLQGMSFSNYLAELGPKAQTQVYRESSLDAAMRDAFHKTRHYLMTAHRLTEDEAVSLISVAVDFGITQVVDGNVGVHAVIDKAIFPNAKETSPAGS